MEDYTNMKVKLIDQDIMNSNLYLDLQNEKNNLSSEIEVLE